MRLARLGSNYVRQLEDEVELVRGCGLVGAVEQRELSREPPKRGVRRVENRVERRLNNTDEFLRKVDFVKRALIGIEEFDAHILGEPFNHLADADRFYVI